MTALEQFERLETLGQWSAVRGRAPTEVVVKFGKSTLTLETGAGEPVVHWSLPAIRKLATANGSAIYGIDEGGEENLILDDPTMCDALDQVIAAAVATRAHGVRRRRRLTGRIVGAGLVLGIGAAIFNASALISLTAPRLVAPERGQVIAADMRPAIEARTGPYCQSQAGQNALVAISNRLGKARPATVHVAHLGEQPYLSLPGDVVVLNARLIETARSAEELAGWLALACINGADNAPVRRLVAAAQPLDGLTFLATGTLPRRAYDRGASEAFSTPFAPNDDALTLTFQTLNEHGIAAEDFARSLADWGGPILDGVSENAATEPPILADGAFVAAQDICGG